MERLKCVCNKSFSADINKTNGKLRRYINEMQFHEKKLTKIIDKNVYFYVMM